jgi:hypothetical protein
MPAPNAANTAKACTGGCVNATPSAAPMNGAVHGDATATASTPVNIWSTSGWRARRSAQPSGNMDPNSNAPSRFNPSNVNSSARPATTRGDCNWNPQPTCAPA